MGGEWDWPDLDWRLGVPNPEGWTKLPHSPRRGSATLPRYIGVGDRAASWRTRGAFRPRVEPTLATHEANPMEEHGVRSSGWQRPLRSVRGPRRWSSRYRHPAPTSERESGGFALGESARLPDGRQSPLCSTLSAVGPQSLSRNDGEIGFQNVSVDPKNPAENHRLHQRYSFPST